MLILTKLYNAGLTNCPSWIPDNLQYLVLHGSHAYGVERPDSDFDYYGVVIPPKDELFPPNEIIGYGKLKNGGNRFTNYQEQHLIDPSDKDKKEYDFNVLNIVDFCELAKSGNPNIVDCLFVPVRCITHTTAVGQLLRENRKLFLSKIMYHKYKGYAFSQLNKATSTNRVGKRKDEVSTYGYDRKFSGHVVRLLDQCEQLLETGDIDLERCKEQHKAIRRGDVKWEEILDIFSRKEKRLEELYNTSDKVPHSPREDEVKDLLFKCLEHHYGSLKGIVERPNLFKDTLLNVEQLLRSISKELHS